MTAELLIVCMAVYASCSLQAPANAHRFRENQREWGAIQTESHYEAYEGIHRSQEIELRGPFDVWDGDWWRIPITALHHDNLLALVLNLGATWYLGSRLERHWGSFAFAVFLLPAICIPTMAELCFGRAITGLSGVCCAMLGVLIVLRHYDATVAECFSEDAADLSVAIVVMGSIATWCDLISFPVAAHWAGFGYGCLLAWITGGPLGRATLIRISTRLMHLWLIPALFLVCHPLWIGRYYWYHASRGRSPQRAERNLERATGLNPALAGAWLQWADLAERRGDRTVAWNRLVDALAANPSSTALIDGTRRLWRHLNPEERNEAETILKNRFGQRSARWLNIIRASIASRSADQHDNVFNNADGDDAAEFRLDRELQLPGIENLPDRPIPQKWQNRNVENDAVEGETL